MAALAAAACGSSATTSTGPTPLARCSLTLSSGEQSFPPEGGAGAIAITAARECSWTVTVEGAWLSVKSGQSGQGDGRVEYSAAANPDPVARRGALVLNTQRAEISQAAAPCVITLADRSANFPSAGGTGRVDVRASSALCSWTASADEPWISIRSGSEGKGSASVAFDVAATTGPPRVGTLSIAGQRFSITQSEGCTYSITPQQFSVGSQGGASQVSINTARQCPWTASSGEDWVSFPQGSGSGPATVSFTVQPTNGPGRVATAVIAGQTFTINQGQGCTYQVQPASHTIAANGGTATVNVNTAEGCTWTTSSDASWISVQGMASGAGAGAIVLAAAANTGPARSATLSIAGQRVTVAQGAGCTYSISPTQENIPAAGGNGRVTVATESGCSWSASSPVSWVRITGGASGSGNGAVSYTVSATDGPARSASLQIAGRTLTVNQGTGCTISLVPATAHIREGAATVPFEVRSGAGCTWTAATQASWIAVASPPNGAGTGTATVQLSVPANPGPPRSGTVAVGGQTFTLGQDGGCSFTVAPEAVTAPAAGTTTRVDVTGTAECSWTTSSGTSWITVSPASSAGSTAANISVAANNGPARSGAVTVAGRQVNVTQESGCTYSINPTSITVPPTGGTGSGFAVSTAAGCSWKAVSQVPWITITSGEGSGDGAVQGTVEPNATGVPRTGTVTIANLTFTVNQQ
jgi:hypothetical protein